MTVSAMSGQWSQRRNLIGLAVFAVGLGLVPLLFHTPYALSTMVFIGIYSIVTMGLCLLMGYAGQVSLGQAAFFGLGAYGSAILTTRFEWSPWIAMVVSAAGTGAVGYLIGMPIFRLRGHYLAMGTLALGIIVTIIADEWKVYTGGPTGLPGVPRLTLGGVPIKSDIAYYYLVWVFVFVALLVGLNIVHSRFGRALRAIRDSEPAAESLGIQVESYKLRTLAVSAVYASVAGSLYVHYMIYISPSAAGLDLSIRLVLMAAIGGMASIWGAPFGAAAVILLTLALREIIPLFTHHGSGEHQIIAYGILLIVIMIFMPRGLTAAGARAWRRMGGLEAISRNRRRRLRRT